ncbi:hypothetical protein [Streptomyces sp. NPDC088915]|uniref:hypothetical protein n=1 Tax=Streptomyces sp. NPDC088915 TaxID=3365912 RepID=UPI00380243A0
MVPVPAVLPLEDAVGRLPLADEDRTGYTRTSFRHWNTGLDPVDGCNTRNEVLLAEAVQEPDVTAGCKLSGGKWGSYYDGVEVIRRRIVRQSTPTAWPIAVADCPAR